VDVPQYPSGISEQVAGMAISRGKEAKNRAPILI